LFKTIIMNYIKTLVGLLIFLCLSVTVFADANTLFWTDKITDNLQNGGDDLVTTADNILGFVIGLLYFIAVVFGLYAGFVILTGAGEEDKMKKWKNIFIYVIVGLIVIFLASQIVRWIISILSDEDIVWPEASIIVEQSIVT